MQHPPESGEERWTIFACADHGWIAEPGDDESVCPRKGCTQSQEYVPAHLAPLEQEATQALHDENEANFERAELVTAAARELLEAVDFGLWAHSGAIVGTNALKSKRDRLRALVAPERDHARAALRGGVSDA